MSFYRTLDHKTRLKLDWTIELIETQEYIPTKYFRHLTETKGIYEIRVEVGSNIFRVFCFFDEGKLVVAINGFQKKSQKTPRSKIETAIRIKKEYFDEKSE